LGCAQNKVGRKNWSTESLLPANTCFSTSASKALRGEFFRID